MLIVSYDFSDDKVRTRFSKFLKKYGWRMQYSVYVVRNSPRILNNIVAEVELSYKKLFKNSDSIIIFQVCETCKKKVIRYGNAKHELEDVIYFE